VLGASKARLDCLHDYELREIDMVWLVLITFYSFYNNPKTLAPVTSTSTSNVLHVGTFSDMSACQAAASGATYVKGTGNAPSYSFVCVNSGTLNN
jgi:hypothetical protein